MLIKVALLVSTFRSWNQPIYQKWNARKWKDCILEGEGCITMKKSDMLAAESNILAQMMRHT